MTYYEEDEYAPKKHSHNYYNKYWKRRQVLIFPKKHHLYSHEETIDACPDTLLHVILLKSYFLLCIKERIHSE